MRVNGRRRGTHKGVEGMEGGGGGGEGEQMFLFSPSVDKGV